MSEELPRFHLIPSTSPDYGFDLSFFADPLEIQIGWKPGLADALIDAAYFASTRTHGKHKDCAKGYSVKIERRDA